MGLAVLVLALHSAAFGQVVSEVRSLVDRGDFQGAEKRIAAERKQQGVTAESILAYSWLARGALAQKQLPQAQKYAAETRQQCLDALKKRGLDDELSNLPIALGASIEVQALAMAAEGRRAEAVTFLKQELQQWHKTSIRARIQKNLHVLSLTGTAPPSLLWTDHLGPNPPAPDSLKGKAVILFFWAHWCPDCKSQGPILAQLRDRYAKKGLVIIGPTQFYGYAARGEDATPAQEKAYIDAVRREHYSGLSDMAVPLNNENFSNFGASTSPTIVLLDKNGIVRVYHPGRMSYEELANELDKVL